MNEQTKQHYARYEKACHAMQTGVAFRMQYDEAETLPKHLRVGVNSSMCEFAALVRLLMAKGVITEEEHAKAIADEMEREVERYKTMLRAHYGREFELI